MGRQRRERKANGKYERRFSFDDIKDEQKMIMVDKVCGWMGGILDEKLNRENVIDKLRNGVLVCRLAEEIQKSVNEYKQTAEDPGPLPMAPPQRYTANCKGRSPEARENVAKFLKWVVEMNIPGSSIFAPDDLLKLRGKFNVINTLLAVSRRTKECGGPDIDAAPKIGAAFAGLGSKSGKKFEHTAAAFGDGEERTLRVVDRKLDSTSPWKVVQQKIDQILQLPGKPKYEIFRG